jgi:UDPglucose 6-dehydrogenase
MENARAQLPGDVAFAASAAECARRADVLAITTPWNEFRALTPADLKTGNGTPTVVDCWRILPRLKFEAVSEYVPFGFGDTPGKALEMAASSEATNIGEAPGARP